MAVLPRGVTLGCGAAAVLSLILVFVGGAFMASGGLVKVVDLSFGMSLGKMRGMYAPDVTAAQKQALEASVESLRANVRAEKVSIARLEPVLQTMQRGVDDGKMTASEVESLTAAARHANRRSQPLDPRR